MSFLQYRKVCFNEQGLPIAYHNLHHKTLVRPKSKSQIEKDLDPRPNFHREIIAISCIPSRSQIQHNLPKYLG